MTCHHLMRQTWHSQHPATALTVHCHGGIARYFTLTAKYHAQQMRLNKHMALWMVGGRPSQSQEEEAE